MAGFKLAQAFVEVDAKDNTEQGERKILARFKGLRPEVEVDADTGKAEASMAKTFGKAGLAAVGAGAGALISAGIANNLDMSEAQSKLKAQLGDGDYAAEMGAVAGGLYAKAYGESLGEVNDAVRLVVQSGALMEDATDEQISAITGRVMSLSSAFGQDLTGSTNAVAQMLRTGLAPDAETALDILTRGFQQGNDKAGDLLDTVNEYGTQFRKLGLDGTTAMGLISQGLKAGARDSDIVADAIKEFSIRAIDGSKTTAEGFDIIGMSSQKMSSEIQKGGPAASAALQLTLTKLREMKDPGERAAAATRLFGTQAEDLGDALYALDLDTAAEGMGNVAGAAEKLDAAVGDNAKAKVEGMRRSFEQWTASIVATDGPLGNVAAGVQAFGPDAMGVLGPLASVLAALKMNGAVGALRSVGGEVDDIGKKAEAAAGESRVGKLRGKLKGLGAGLGLALIAGAVAEIGDKGEHAGDQISGSTDALRKFGEAAGSLDAGFFLQEFIDEAKYGLVVWHQLTNTLSGFHLDPIDFDVNTGPAVAAVDGLLGQINGASPTVNINGNDNGAAFALREILAQIAAGKESVTIDGHEVPAQEALHRVKGMIDNSVGTVTVNGKTMPASEAVGLLVKNTNGRRADISVGANTSAAQGVVDGFIERNDGRKIRIFQSVLGSGGIASAGRLATGGPVKGPGTGTSDTAGLFALSNGEHVLTAREVRNAGGHGAIERIRAALDRGSVRGLAAGGPATQMAPVASMPGLSDRPVVINIHQQASSPMETGRFVALALRGA